jgi:purine-binding chemotaxis protein CheW
MRAAWLVCRTGKIRFALPIGSVVEITRLLPIAPLAQAPDYVRGIAVIRGAPLPVVDAGLAIGNEKAEPNRLVIIRTGAKMLALAVGEVIGVAALETDAFVSLPPLLRDAAAGAIDSIGARDRELLVVLQAGRLLPDAVLRGFDKTGIAA